MVKKKIENKKIPKKVKNNNNYNVQQLKKIIKKKLYSHLTNQNQNQNENLLNPLFSQNLDENEEKDYYQKYVKYMTEDFNSTIVSMVITYINKHKDDIGINPHLLNPNYLKLTEAEENKQ